jgi:competence protein ComEC
VRSVAAVPAAGLLAGAAAGLLVSESPLSTWGPVLAGPTLVLSICTGIAGVVWRRSRVVIASVVVGFFVGGAAIASVAWQRAWRPPLRVAFEELARSQRREAEAEGRRLPEDDEAFAVVEGILRADASPSESGISLAIDVDRIDGGRVTGGIAVTVVGSLAATSLNDWPAGRRVRVPVALRRPSRYLDPGVPDHERALARRGTSLVGTVKSGALVDVVAHGTFLDEMFGRVRAFARGAIAASVGRWDQQSSAIVAAIVIGDRAGLDERVQRRLQEAGTYHVIAISGGNIAILAGLLLGLFRVGGWLGRAAMLSAIVALWVYARLVGGGASVDRATLMAVVHFGARAFDQRSPPLNALAVVAALLVAVDPLSVADPAFVLTCGATLSILLVVPTVMQLELLQQEVAQAFRPAIAIAALKRCATFAIPLLAASAAAEAMLFPVNALVFSRVTFAGLALNFLAIPLMAVAQIAGMALVPIALVSPAGAALVGWIAHVGAIGLIWSADFVRFVPISSYRIAPPAWAVVLVYYGALGAWWILRRRRADLVGSAESDVARRARGSAACIAIATALWIVLDPSTIVASRGDGRLHMTFVDVGQGDAIFVVFPHGSTLLVDAGGLSPASFDVGDRVVAPVIRDAGFYRLDYLALTHGDPDHIGGAASIIEEFRPREVWEGIPFRGRRRSRRCVSKRSRAAASGSMSTPARDAPSTKSRSSPGIRPSRIGSARKFGTTTRSCWNYGGATSRSC